MEDKAMIILGGSDGSRRLTKAMARRFCQAGITSLGLLYINAPGMPRHTMEVPVESVERAVYWLKNKGFSKVGIWGMSSGGELALLSASLIPQIGCVVAVSAPTAVCQADNGRRAFATSCWTWRGKTLPYLPVRFSVWRTIPKSMCRRELFITDQYERAVHEATEDVWIEVEKIQGPVLTIAARDDTVCPSVFFGEVVEKRLNNACFPYPHQHLIYDYASHFIVPGEWLEKKAFRIERRNPSKCQTSCEDAFEKAVNWIKAW